MAEVDEPPQDDNSSVTSQPAYERLWCCNDGDEIPEEHRNKLMTTLCNHICHSYCFFHYEYYRCGNCRGRLYHRYEGTGADSIGDRVRETTEALQNSETAEKEFRALRLALYAARKAKAAFGKKAMEHTRLYKISIQPHENAIRQMKKTTEQTIRGLPERREFKRLWSTAQRKFTLLANKYDFSRWWAYRLANTKIGKLKLSFMRQMYLFRRRRRWYGAGGYRGIRIY
jgi:hypothetical protein